MQFVFNNAFTYTKQKIYYQPFISRTWSLIVSRVLVTREDENAASAYMCIDVHPTGMQR